MKSRRTLCNSDKQGEKRRFAGSTIAIIKGMDVRTVTSVLLKLSRRRRFQVWEITLDMALDIEQTTRVCFPAARRVIDRFHVLKLAYKAIQEMRIKIRWETLDEESMQMTHARAYRKTYHAPVFENSDSRKAATGQKHLSTLQKRILMDRIIACACRYSLQEIS